MEFVAPSHWQTIDLLSDIHLDAGEPETFQLWRSYLGNTPADAVFILGDLFEVWVGDDVLDTPQSFEHQCAEVLKAAGARLSLFLMAGNRDFLMGAALMARCNARAIDDPFTLVFGQQRIVLSHGDAQCIADTDYQAFRKLVRSPQWQQEFLGKPLSERRAIARSIRNQSESKKSSGEWYADVDAVAALELLKVHDAAVLIHGHTHRPGQVDLGNANMRWVLSDWVVKSTPPRADVLRLTADGDSRVRITRIQGSSIAGARD
jgi:UDP-2,3-diacylglucosamine hydrolase